MVIYVVRIVLVVLLAVILITAFSTGYALAKVGTNSPETVDVLMKYYKISFIAAFAMLIPLILLFDSLLEKKTRSSQATDGNNTPRNLE